MDNFIFVDAQTKRKGMIRITAFGKTVEEVARHYQNWAKENKLVQEDIWYANIFECGSNKHLAYLKINNPQFEIDIYPVTKSKVDPFHRSIRDYLRLIFS